jgi:uncharacterized protein with GYD domain
MRAFVMITVEVAAVAGVYDLVAILHVDDSQQIGQTVLNTVILPQFE